MLLWGWIEYPQKKLWFWCWSVLKMQVRQHQVRSYLRWLIMLPHLSCLSSLCYLNKLNKKLKQYTQRQFISEVKIQDYASNFKAHLKWKRKMKKYLIFSIPCSLCTHTSQEPILTFSVISWMHKDNSTVSIFEVVFPTLYPIPLSLSLGEIWKSQNCIFHILSSELSQFNLCRRYDLFNYAPAALR